MYDLLYIKKFLSSFFFLYTNLKFYAYFFFFFLQI